MRIMTFWNYMSCSSTHIKVVANLRPTCGGLPCIEDLEIQCKLIA